MHLWHHTQGYKYMSVRKSARHIWVVPTAVQRLKKDRRWNERMMREKQSTAWNLCRVGDLFVSRGQADVCFSALNLLPFGLISLPSVCTSHSHCVSWVIGVLADRELTKSINQARSLLTWPLSGLPNQPGRIPLWKTEWRWQIVTGDRFMLPKHSAAFLSQGVAGYRASQIFLRHSGVKDSPAQKQTVDCSSLL